MVAMHTFIHSTQWAEAGWNSRSVWSIEQILRTARVTEKNPALKTTKQSG